MKLGPFGVWIGFWLAFAIVFGNIFLTGPLVAMLLGLLWWRYVSQ